MRLETNLKAGRYAYLRQAFLSYTLLCFQIYQPVNTDALNGNYWNQGICDGHAWKMGR